MLLAKAKQFVLSGRGDGVACPCCSQFCKIYKRKLNSTMARSIVWLVREYGRNGGRWIDVPRTAPRFIIQTNQLGTILHWDLLETKPTTDTTKKSSGFWRPTERGIDFAHRRVSVPSHVLLYLNELESWSDEYVYVDDCLGQRFDYQELMSA